MSELHSRIQAALMGSPTAFETLITEFARKLYSIAFALTQNAKEAELALVDVFLDAYTRREQIRSSEDFPVWLVAQTRERARERIQAAPQEADAHVVLREMSERDREAFTLRALDRLSYSIIDARLGLGAGGGHRVRNEVLRRIRESTEKRLQQKLEPLPSHVEDWALGELDGDLSASDAEELKRYLGTHPEAQIWMKRETGLFETLTKAFEAARADAKLEERIIAKFREKAARVPRDFLLLRRAFDGFWSRVLVVAVPSVVMFFVGAWFSRLVVTEEANTWQAPQSEAARLEEKIAAMRVQSYRSGEIRVRAASAGEATNATENTVGVFQGRVQRKKVDAAKGTIELTVRIPGIRFDEFMSQAEAQGTLVSVDTKTSEASGELRDLGKSFRVGLETENRLVELLQSGKSNLEETLKIETELRRLRETLDAIRIEVASSESRALNPEVIVTFEEGEP